LADIADTRRLLAATRPEWIFHLASHVAGSRAPDLVIPTFRNNLTSTIHLLTAAAEFGCNRILLAGSFEESDAGDSEAIPAFPYAASKWAASAYGRMFHKLYKLPVVLLRIFMVYGPGQLDSTKLIPYVILSLLQGQAPQLSSGRRMVDWIYVDDVVEGLVATVLTPGIEGKTIDIGSGNLVPIKEIVENLTELVDPSIRPVFGALPERPFEQVRTANIAETQMLTGWNARITLKEGLRQTVAWYERQLKNEVLIAANRRLSS
jgi:nucleoside-diphosphate-sugar epimerase